MHSGVLYEYIFRVLENIFKSHFVRVLDCPKLQKLIFTECLSFSIFVNLKISNSLLNKV